MTRDDRLTRRDALKGLASVGVGTALTGCSAEAVPGNEPGVQLRYAGVLPPISLDPIEHDDPWSAQAANATFQGLYARDYDLNLVPVLADGRPSVSEDGTTYTVSLVDDARFQSGTRVSSEDVKYSFEAPLTEETPPLWQVNMVNEVRTPDESTVEFHLDHPYPAFEHSLTRSIVPKSVREGNPVAFGVAPDTTVGSGPYRPHLFKEAKYGEFRTWSNYWGDRKSDVDRLKMTHTHAGLARTAALKTGQSDIVERVQPKLWTATKRIPSASVTKVPSFHYFFLGFNCSSGPTTDPRVREAVDYLLSMDSFVKHVIEPVGERQHSPLPRRLAEAWGMPVEKWRSIPRRKNVEKAKVLFEEAGVKTWSPTVAVPRDDKMRTKLAHGFVRGLNSAGFPKARVKKYHWSDFRKKVTSGNEHDYSMYVGSWAGSPDPDTFLYPLFHQRMQGLTNGVYYTNPDVMEAIARARRTDDRKRRQSLYERAITTILQDRVHLPAFTLHNSFGVKDHVDGFRPHPLAGSNPRLSVGDDPLSIRRS